MYKKKLIALYEACNKKFFTQFGFFIEDATFSKVVDYMYTPKDSSSLAITRILFGLAMLFDIPDERGGAIMERRWGDPKTCHFPLLPFIQPAPMPYMAAVYAGLWFGAIGIMLGYKYRFAASIFTICYWYLFLIEKSYWNNHSYLFGLVALLLTFTEAGSYWSLDAYLDPSKLKPEIPYWNYFILKYQFFILYFMAGLKKGTSEWLTGYSVQNLSEHWVFEPFKLFLTVPQIDYLIVHWFVFMFDLTVAIWMMYSYTRNVAMVFCAMFHLMNSRLFRIGMFPWVCLATMPLFYPVEWPKKLQKHLKIIKSYICIKISMLKLKEYHYSVRDNGEEMGNVNDTLLEEEDNFDDERSDDLKDNVLEDINNDHARKEERQIVRVISEIIKKKGEDKHDKFSTTKEYNRKKITVCFIAFYVMSQAFLPYSHFITQGYNNWTNGLYGYSWDMMVHTWDTHAIIVQVVDNERHKVFYVDPHIYTPNERWTRHADMVHQYAKCLKENLINDAKKFRGPNEIVISDNISIYVDVWCSMNGRFTQRLFDSNVDLLKAEWNPFDKVSFVMPLLDEALHWRTDLERIKKDVHSWNNYSDVIFLADFPGYEHEKYISEDLKNVTLTILEGVVAYQPEITNSLNGHSIKLHTGEQYSVNNGLFHKVLNIGHQPAFYMYTFYNSSDVEANGNLKEVPMLPVATELLVRFSKMFTFCNVMLQTLVQLFFSFSKCQ